MIVDPFFYVVAIPAVIFFGMAKGGMGSAFGLVSVPLMSLAVPPLQAAAILLTILLVMDAVAVKSFWKEWDELNLRLTLPGAMLGILVGTFTFQYFSDAAIRLLLGVMVVMFVANYFLNRNLAPKLPTLGRGAWWGGLAGFTSFGIHAGGPPISIFVLPQRLEKRRLIATFAFFFAVVNIVKLVPYAALGQFSRDNVLTSLVLIPLAPIGVLLGIWLLDKINEDRIYALSYFGLGLLGIKLSYDGLNGLLG
ncbi:MAG: sulfite exporter TauE/SafE family protein [Arenicella sp.]|nr:sulfite exporter TauE/SafE family protein [Arenicella sp.]